MENKKEKELMEKAAGLFKDGQHKAAKLILTDIVETNDRHVDAFFYLANIFHIEGNIGKAIKAFRKVLQIDPGHTDASIGLSVLYNDIGEYEQGKKIFDMADERVKSNTSSPLLKDLHINKKFALKHNELAELYLSYGRYDEALFEFNKVVALDSENLEVRMRIAKVYAKKGFTSRAFDELRKLKNENPSYLPARVALGVLYYGSGNIIEAQAEWGKVLAKDPNHKDASMYLNLSKTATETSIR